MMKIGSEDGNRRRCLRNAGIRDGVPQLMLS